MNMDHSTGRNLKFHLEALKLTYGVSIVKLINFTQIMFDSSPKPHYLTQRRTARTHGLVLHTVVVIHECFLT